ncbi:hypothetical protein OEV98_13140 [Caldibacillus lycopersici]|uniref:Uncharacterized protein n=1 Tax=Perspicuibacillus lycopersici TaxID=1325689 RepID=A0AAE3LRC6_9BACI|nr:hypothetical protein [Perspicuibacillus lycopersici]MCU9614484.1 hypothetical protein [Perspicuibacillus lycopersici]
MKKTKQLLTDTPQEEKVSVSTEMNSRYPLQAQHYYPGDSVNEHKNIEEANIMLSEGEVGQQRENN